MDKKILGKNFDQLWQECFIGLAFVSKEGKWLKVNKALCELLEYTELEMSHLNFQDVTSPEDLNDDKEMALRVAEGKIGSYTMSKRYITKTGRTVWIKLKVVPLFDENDNFYCYFSQLADPKYIEEKKQIEVAVNYKKELIKWLGKNHKHMYPYLVIGYFVLGKENFVKVIREIIKFIGGV